MSLDATRWAWRVPVKTAGQRLVLLNLADRANENGQCWPSQKRIARDTCLGERSVRSRLAELQALGLIRRQHRSSGAGKTSDLTTLLMEGEAHAAAAATPAHKPANHAASNRRDLPLDTGISCLQTDHYLTNQTEPDSNEHPIWLELMPQPNRPDIDRHNYAAALATDVARFIGAADWNDGLLNLDLVESWLDGIEMPMLRECLIQTATRAKRAGTTIYSWHYFAKSVDKLPTKNERR
jgi:hypothetical protein